MIGKALLSSLFIIISIVVGWSCQAIVDVDHPSSLPKQVIVIPENRGTSSLIVSFNETVRDNNVTVVCQVIKPSNGDSQVTFSSVTATVGQNKTTVTYRIISSGQPAQVQCSAQSEGDPKQFAFSTSKGKVGSLQITKAPVVTICDEPFIITSDSGCQTVQVELSEVVTGPFPVVVNCSTVNNNGGPQFQFEATIIRNGEKTSRVPFVTVSKGTTTQSTQVVCKAQTHKVTMLPSWYICGGTVTPTVTPTTNVLPLNVTTIMPITVPTPSPPVVLNITRFETSTVGVDYFQYSLDNSAGMPVAFILDTLALQFNPSSVSLHSGYSVILSINTPLTVPLDIECSLILVPPGPINSSAVDCPSEPVGSITLTSSSVQLQLAQTEIQFKKSEVSKSIIISINGIPSSRLSDLVRLSCCPKSTAVLKPSSVAMFLFIDLYRYQPISSTSGTSQLSTSPLDIDLTCPCNLKEGQCDTGCCCDKDCSTTETASFSCMKGFFGGDGEERPFEFSCQATWPDATDLQPIICVVSSSSPFIGYWYNYTTPRSAKDLPEYKTLIQSASKQTRFSYQSSTQSQSSADDGYKLGTSIKTAVNSNDNNYISASLGTLVLPKKVFSGLCSQSVPVRFLEDSEWTCVTEVVESLCSASSSLSASSYLMPRDITSPPCPVPAAVLRAGMLSPNQNEKPDLADVDVQYFCTAGDDFVKSSPWRCAFDDGKTAPPLPVVNQTSSTCSNVVLNVTYRFDISGQKINKVKITVILGSMRLQSQSYSNLATSESSVNTVTQSFQTTFVRISNSSNDSTVSLRSGNPGYIRGLPVLTRSGNSSKVTSLPIPSPRGDALCTSSSVPVNFGETSSTGCVMKLGINDMDNCTRVREMVQANRIAILKGTHVGRTGNARAEVDEDWLPIIRESLKEPLVSYRFGVCHDIPYSLVVEVLVSEVGRYKDVPQMEIVGLKMSYKYTTWQFRCVSGNGLNCKASSNVTQSNVSVTPSVSATVMPSVTVSVNVSINGSLVTNDNKTIPNGGGESSSYVPGQTKFFLETNVVFIQVPATESKKLKRSIDQSGTCYQDVCKEELFYPLSPAYQGESKDKVMTYFIFLVFIALVTFHFTRPWG